jgi:methionyl-tRNA synthetase
MAQRIFAHGWWTRDGEKMSKSVGNVLDPVELVNLYGVDYVRYFLASEFHFGNDGDFSHEQLCHRINLHLANDLGNLAQRTLTMIYRNCDAMIPAPGALTAEDEEVLKALSDSRREIKAHLDEQAVKSICDCINGLAKLGNKYFDTNAPWLLVKTDPARLRTVLFVLSELLRHSAIVLQPVMPASCDHMLDLLGISGDPTSRDFAALPTMISPGTKIKLPKPVFPKLEMPTPVATSPTQDAVSQAVAANCLVYDALSPADLTAKIAEVGTAIRAMKLAKVSKDELKPFLQELTYLKKR